MSSPNPRPRAGTALLTDVEAALRRAVRGEVRFDAGQRALYACDASNYRQVPLGVVWPRTDADVEAALEVCRSFSVPLLMRGAGTSLAGQACNTAVVLDTSRHLDRILELDPGTRRARVQPGVVLDRLQEAAARSGLMFGPDPSTHAVCTLGGMIGNNACGVHSVSAGKTVDNVEELEILTAPGQRLRLAAGRLAGSGDLAARLTGLRDRHAAAIRAGFPVLPRRVSGYNLDQLLPENGFHVARALVGTEGTCAVVLSATLRLVPRPAARVLLVAGYPDLVAAAEAVPEILEHRPDGLEGLDQHFRRFDSGGLLPAGDAWLLAELGGARPAEAAARAARLQAALVRGGRWPVCRLLQEAPAQARLWNLRAAAVGSTSRLADGTETWPGWEDSAVAPQRLGGYLRDLGDLLREHGLRGVVYGHFGDGCVHARLTFRLREPDGVRRYRSFVEAAAALVVRHGGSLSGEHGDGQARGELLGRMFGADLLQAFREFKTIWDPEALLNPGKVVDPLPLDRDLRVAATGETPPVLSTRLRFAADRGSFARAVDRCVGVGRCRKRGEGVMCPSFQVTRDETHSPRGRARLLGEMLRGQLVTGGWRDQQVREALELCLSCKACKTECPAGVDIAAYKAEFLHQSCRRRPRSPAAYAFGHVCRWLRLGAMAPRLVNTLAGAAPLAALVKGITGMAPDRQLPRLASETLVRWFRRRTGGKSGASPVLLWPDTFTNHLQPQVGRAAVRLLENAGFAVHIPDRWLCCGRPLFDLGMLDTAARWLQQVLQALEGPPAGDLPVVVLEPSCLSVFRDELVALFPEDDRARRLAARAWLLDEFLATRDVPLRVVQPDSPVLVQGHCHQQALMGMQSTAAVLARAGIDARILDAGCCGMAGAFGWRRRHAGISRAIGEQAVLPALRRASPGTVIVAEGFSCREQIRQETARSALHLSEILQIGRR